MAVLQQDGSHKIPEGTLTSATVEDVWDEERLDKAMKTLKEMHIQVKISLRSNDPSVDCCLASGPAYYYPETHSPPYYTTTFTYAMNFHCRSLEQDPSIS